MQRESDTTWTMTTRKSQSSEKKQTSAGESTSRNQESARKIRKRHQELATQESVKAGDAASEPRGKAESREVRRETERSQQCKSSIQQRVLEARNRDPIAAGDEEQGKRRSCQQVSGRFTRSDDKTPKERVVGLMKHMPNGREERKTARDGTQGPKKKKNIQGWDPRTHERKSRANSKQSCDLIFEQWRRIRESQNPARAIKLEKLVLPSW